MKPEDALAIFRDVAMVLDDAEIDEVYKKSVTDDVETNRIFDGTGRRQREWIAVRSGSKERIVKY